MTSESTSPFDNAIRERSLADFDIRKHFHRLVIDRSTLPLPAKKPVADNFKPHIWAYWKQGIDSAPPIVRACLRQLQMITSPSEVTILAADNIGGFVDIPGYVHDKLANNPTHFSDVLRVCLLATHGGIWTDATCFVTSNPLRDFSQLTSSGFFAFSRNKNDQYMMSNWFLAATPDQHIPHTMRNTLLEY